MPLNPRLCQPFFCIKWTRPWLRTASWKHGLLQHLCFGFPIRVTLVTLQTLNKTSTTKLSSISCLIWSPHGNIWQHSKNSKVPRPEPTRTGLQQGLPHILAGVPGLCRVASCDDGYESRTRVKRNNVVNKDVSRCFKMFQLAQKDVWISDEVSCSTSLVMTSPRNRDRWETKIDDVTVL